MDSTPFSLRRCENRIPMLLRVTVLTVIAVTFAGAQVATGNISGYIRN